MYMLRFYSTFTLVVFSALLCNSLCVWTLGFKRCVEQNRAREEDQTQTKCV